MDIRLESKGVEKENSAVPTGKRRRENVSIAAENEMNPKKKPRQETIEDPKGVKTTFPIPSSAEYLTSGLEISSESAESSDLKEVRRLLEEGRLDAERKSREAEQLKKALTHLFSNRSIWTMYLNYQS